MYSGSLRGAAPGYKPLRWSLPDGSAGRRRAAEPERVPDEGWPDQAERTLMNSAPAANQRNILAGRRRPPGRILFVLFAGSVIGAVISLLLYSTTPAYGALLPFGGALLLPTLFLKNFRLYWLALFL